MPEQVPSVYERYQKRLKEDTDKVYKLIDECLDQFVDVVGWIEAPRDDMDEALHRLASDIVRSLGIVHTVDGGES